MLRTWTDASDRLCWAQGFVSRFWFSGAGPWLVLLENWFLICGVCGTRATHWDTQITKNTRIA